MPRANLHGPSRAGSRKKKACYRLRQPKRYPALSGGRNDRQPDLKSRLDEGFEKADASEPAPGTLATGAAIIGAGCAI
ncbi:hypothetical protein [Paenibacillus sp. BK720]|uniref:hypothetical protein n=1 Tax=Paenibacillus sp. BK720 TaxID=2587092 RepID=UPI001ABAA8BE|nr:hypothetical protein [Paenibacillus sp. BK720]